MVLQIQINRLWNITACHTYSVSLELKEYLGAGSLATILFYNGQCLLRLYQREYMIQRRIWHDLCSSSQHTYYVGEVWARLDQWTGIHVLHMIRGQVPAFNSTFDLDIGLRSIHQRTSEITVAAIKYISRKSVLNKNTYTLHRSPVLF